MMDQQEKELYTVRMLGLQLPTDPRWVNLAEMDLEEILTDHAYCEQKAATSCISLIQQYPERKELVKELAPIVTEEWGHFRMVLMELEKRDLQLGQQRKGRVRQCAAKVPEKGRFQRRSLVGKTLGLCTHRGSKLRTLSIAFPTHQR